MKYRLPLLIVIGLSFFALPAFSQSPVEVEINQEPAKPVPAVANRPISDNYIYYKDNIVSYLKNHLGIENIYEQYPSFPKFEDTGSKKVDCEKFKNEVDLWIEDNDEFRKKYQVNISK